MTIIADVENESEKEPKKAFNFKSQFKSALGWECDAASRAAAAYSLGGGNKIFLFKLVRQTKISQKC